MAAGRFFLSHLIGCPLRAPVTPNPYKASCCQEANDSRCEQVRHFFARPSAPVSPVDSLCLISAPRFRERKQSCTKHLLRFRPPDVSGGCARSSSWRHRETLRCPDAVPLNSAGLACMHAIPLGPGSGKGQDRQPGVCARGDNLEARNGRPINPRGCRDCRAAQAPLVRAPGPRA